MNITEIKQGYYNFIEEMESKVGEHDVQSIQLQTDSKKELVIITRKANTYQKQLNITSFILDEELYRLALGFKVLKEDQLLSKFADIWNIYDREGSNFDLEVYKINDDNPYAKFITNSIYSIVRAQTTGKLFEFLKGLIDDQFRKDIYNSTFNNLDDLPTKPFITQLSYDINFTDEQTQKYNDLANMCISKLEESINDKIEQLRGRGHREGQLSNIHLKSSDLGKLNVVATIKYNACHSNLCYFTTKEEEEVRLTFISQDYYLYPYVKKHYPQYSDQYFSNIVFIDSLSPEFRFMTSSIVKDYNIGDGNREHAYERRPTARYVINVWDLQQWNYKERSYQSRELLTRYLKLLMNNPRYKEEYDVEFNQQHVSTTYSTSETIDTTDQKLRKEYIDTIDKIIGTSTSLLEEGIDHSVEQLLKDNKEITTRIYVGGWRKCEGGKRHIDVGVSNSGLASVIILQEDIQDHCWNENNYTLAIDNSIFNFLYGCSQGSRNSITKITNYLKGLIDSPKCEEQYKTYKREYQVKLEEAKLSTNSSNATANIRDSIIEVNKRLNLITSSTYLHIDQIGDSGLPALPGSSSGAVSTMSPPVMHQAVFFTWLAYMLSPVINPVFNYISSKINGRNHASDEKERERLNDEPSTSMTEVRKQQLDKKGIIK